MVFVEVKDCFFFFFFFFFFSISSLECKTGVLEIAYFTRLQVFFEFSRNGVNTRVNFS